MSLVRLTGLTLPLLRLRLSESLRALLLSTLGLLHLRTLVRGTLTLGISVLSALALGALASRILPLSASLLSVLPGKSLLGLGA